MFFKRVFSMFFPTDLINRALSPVNFFISVIQPRRFFIVVNRKVVENYKLNLFDINLEKFEVKLVWGSPQFQSLDLWGMDEYYAYQIGSYFNWYRFYSPGNIALGVGLMSAVIFNELFKKYGWEALVVVIRSVFDFVYIFAAKLKVFDSSWDEKARFNWLIANLQNYMKWRLKTAKSPLAQNEQFFKDVFSHIDFFKLFYFLLADINQVVSFETPTKKYYEWLLKEQWLELRGEYKELVEWFLENWGEIVYQQEIDKNFIRIVELILPADNLLFKYLFTPNDWQALISSLLTWIFKEDSINKFTKMALKWENPTSSFVNYILDFRLYKKSYFLGIKKFLVALFAHTQEDLISEDEIKEIEEMVEKMSRGESIPNFKVPERLRQESMVMERLLNFYVSFIGGLQIGRGDNFELRLFGKEVLQKASYHLVSKGISAQDMDFLFGMLDNYYTNEFYYRYIFGHVKAGEEEVRIPVNLSNISGYNRDEILSLLMPAFITYLFEDINQKDVKVFVEEVGILEDFQSLYGKKLKKVLSSKNLFKKIYWYLEKILWEETLATLEHYIDDNKLKLLKDNLYTYDFWLFEDFKEMFLEAVGEDQYISPIQRAGVLWWARETLLGFLILFSFYSRVVKDLIVTSPISIHIMGMEEVDKKLAKDINEAKIDKFLRWLEKLYLVDILWITPDYYPKVRDWLRQIFEKNKELLKEWERIDENKKILNLWWKFQKKEFEAKNNPVYMRLSSQASKEEIAWYRNFFRSINYYNKRYLIPK